MSADCQGAFSGFVRMHNIAQQSRQKRKKTQHPKQDAAFLIRNQSAVYGISATYLERLIAVVS